MGVRNYRWTPSAFRNMEELRHLLQHTLYLSLDIVGFGKYSQLWNEHHKTIGDRRESKSQTNKKTL